MSTSSSLFLFVKEMSQQFPLLYKLEPVGMIKAMYSGKFDLKESP